MKDTILENLLQVMDNLDNIEQIYDDSREYQSQCDLKISDIMHYLQDNYDKLNPVKHFPLLKELARLRVEREKAKCNVIIYKEFKNYDFKRLEQSGNRELLKVALHKVIKPYRNRYYSDDFREIFDREGVING